MFNLPHRTVSCIPTVKLFRSLAHLFGAAYVIFPHALYQSYLFPLEATWSLHSLKKAMFCLFSHLTPIGGKAELETQQSIGLHETREYTWISDITHSKQQW
jgi:hypothetical protein